MLFLNFLEVEIYYTFKNKTKKIRAMIIFFMLTIADLSKPDILVVLLKNQRPILFETHL